MLIIGDSDSCAIKYDKKSTKIKYVYEDGLAKLKINNVEFASSKDTKAIHILFSRLMIYCERYRRKDDTFDMRREMKIINKELKRNKYKDYEIDAATVNLCVGYPTYTS